MPVEGGGRMRLIDADETLRLMKYEGYKLEYEKHDGFYEAKKFILKQPTVEAIPTKWIEQYIWGADTHEEKRALRKMYMQWEKENEGI